MKIIKIIGHPVSVMCMYLLLIISGKSFGGFYVLFIFLGLPHGVPDAIVSTVGLGIMLLGYKVYRKKFHLIKPALYLLGDAVMIAGLVLFFQVAKDYSNATFQQAVPRFSFALFGLCVVCNILLAGLLIIQNGKSNTKPLQAWL
jgi:hypothetical protein